MQIVFQKDITLNGYDIHNRHTGLKFHFTKSQKITALMVIKRPNNYVDIIFDDNFIPSVFNDTSVIKICEVKGAQEFYQEIARKLDQMKNLTKTGQGEQAYLVGNLVDKIVRDYLPHGSGFDNGTKLDWDKSNHNKLVFTTAFHHMDINGYYSGWTEHEVIITPDLMFGFNVKVTGKNRNDIKEYIHSCFSDFEYKG